MPVDRIAREVAEVSLTQDEINILRDWALGDARETFTSEQLAHWYHDVKVNDPPRPEREWLCNWLNDGFEERQPHSAEWTIYEQAYRNCLRRALFKLDELWECYEKAMEDDDADAIEIDNDTTDQCLTAMEGE